MGIFFKKNIKKQDNLKKDTFNVGFVFLINNVKNCACGMELYSFIRQTVLKANEINNTNIKVEDLFMIFVRRHANELNNMTIDDFHNRTFGIHTLVYNYYLTLIDENYIKMKQYVLKEFTLHTEILSVDKVKQIYSDLIDDCYIEEIQKKTEDYLSDESNFMSLQVDMDAIKIFEKALKRLINQHPDLIEG